MKKIRTGSLLLAIVFALATAFTPNQTQEWFIYNGGAADPTDPDSYHYVDGQVPECDSDESLCAVKADNDGNNKPTSSSLQSINTTYGFDNAVPGIINFKD